MAEDSPLDNQTRSNLFREMAEAIRRGALMEPAGGSAAMKRMNSTISSPIAVKKMVAYMESKGLGQSEFALIVGTTDRTLRSFRKTGRIRRDIFGAIATAMETTKEALLKPEGLLKWNPK